MIYIYSMIKKAKQMFGPLQHFCLTLSKFLMFRRDRGILLFPLPGFNIVPLSLRQWLHTILHGLIHSIYPCVPLFTYYGLTEVIKGRTIASEKTIFWNFKLNGREIYWLSESTQHLLLVPCAKFYYSAEI